MKTSLRTLFAVGAVLLALAAFAQFADLVSLPGMPTAALFGGCIVCTLLVFMLGDYAQKPAFRVRRTEGGTAETSNGAKGAKGSTDPGPDWTYT